MTDLYDALKRIESLGGPKVPDKAPVDCDLFWLPKNVPVVLPDPTYQRLLVAHAMVDVVQWLRDRHDFDARVWYEWSLDEWVSYIYKPASEDYDFDADHAKGYRTADGTCAKLINAAAEILEGRE